jgi:hypothetical protein
MGGISALFSEPLAPELENAVARAQASTPYRGIPQRETDPGGCIGIQCRLDETAIVADARSILAFNGYLSPLSTSHRQAPSSALRQLLDAGAYAQLQQLDGEFSLVYRNRQTHECVFYCSPSATRPLFFAVHRDRLSVCTEIRQALRLAQLPTAPDRQAIAQHLAFGHQALDLERTVYRHAHRASSGCVYRFDARDRVLRRQPFPGPPSPDPTIDRTDAGRRMLDNVCDAISASAHPAKTGLAMSGGLDSGLILACLQKRRPELARQTVTPYSIHFPGWEMDEAPSIAETLGRLNTQGRQVDGTNRPPSKYFEELASRLDHPPAVLTDSYIDILAPLMKSDGCRYRLSGFAGDFTLGFGQSYLGDYFRHGKPWRAMIDAALFQNIHPFSILSALRGIYHRVLFPACSRTKAPPVAPAWLHPDQRDTFDGGAARECAYVREFGYALGPRLWLLAVLRSGAWSDLVEQRCAQWELETLNPLAHQRVVDFTFRVAPHWLDGRKHNRALIREAARQLLPDSAREYRGKVVHDRYVAGDRELLRFADNPQGWHLTQERIVDSGAAQQLIAEARQSGIVSVLLGRILRMEYLLRRPG